MTVIQGQLVRGLGKAADFTQLDWVRRQLIEHAGIDPHPGTGNLGPGGPGPPRLPTGSSFGKGVVPEDRHDAEAIIKALSAHAGREWPRVLREHGKVFEGLAQTLDAIKRMGIRLGIVSGARPEVLELLRRDGILDRFDSIVP